jgi:hypothetical protein
MRITMYYKQMMQTARENAKTKRYQHFRFARPRAPRLPKRENS